MNAPPFPSNPQPGEWSGNWVWSGARWVAAPTTGLRVLSRTFTASGPYMPTPGLVSLTVECIGGGGGGGSVYDLSTTNVVLAGAGGGSGGYSRKTLSAALVRGGVLVTVGENGAGGQPTDAVGQAGQPTSFGALCVANGGEGGGTMSAGQFSPNPGPGASPGIGDVVLPGNAGDPGYWQYWPTPTNITSAGPKGGAIAGGVQAQVVGQSSAANGAGGWPNTGAGGGGAVQNQDPGGGAAGGPGGSGVCIVTEYVFGDRDQPVTEWRPPLDVNVTMRPPKPPWPGGPPGPPPWPGGGPWPPGSPWWWWGPGPWPSSSLPGPRPREAVEFEAGQPYDQSINPETGLPWEDDT